PLPLYVYWLVAPRVLHSFPTRRSSDLRVRHELELRDLVRAHLAREDEGEVILQAGKERSPGLHEVPRPETDRELPITTKVVIDRSEEHTSELQSRFDLVCRLLLEKKKD